MWQSMGVCRADPTEESLGDVPGGQALRTPRLCGMLDTRSSQGPLRWAFRMHSVWGPDTLVFFVRLNWEDSQLRRGAPVGHPSDDPETTGRVMVPEVQLHPGLHG